MMQVYFIGIVGQWTRFGRMFKSYPTLTMVRPRRYISLVRLRRQKDVAKYMYWMAPIPVAGVA